MPATPHTPAAPGARAHAAERAGPADEDASPLELAMRSTVSTSTGAGPYSQVRERLGIAVCGGHLPPGTVITLEAMEEVLGASRGVVRESTRVLAAMGLLRARKRIGFVVQPESEWNLFDPQVIHWRLMSEQREQQVTALLEVRIAIEPEAARLAAERADPASAGQIMSTGGQLWATGVEGDQESFLRHDTRFHELILHASGNPMFGRLSHVIQGALRERHQLHEHPIDVYDVQLHVDLATQIQRKRGERAREIMREIITRTSESAHR